ncbi:agmatine deiminase family protein [Parasphingorhabdus sp.]|uniref:agmatine deiminase family protein n=1 Tax=Parasphingorhabdus sp. TaxID=2709688 RepID=UPI003266A991
MRWPAEWEPHQAVWIGFPGDVTEWPDRLLDAQREVAAFANAVFDQGRGEHVILTCRTAADGGIAKTLVDERISIIVEPFGDIWLRDTGPIITCENGTVFGNDFGFNGWGGKFDMPGDQDIGRRLAESRNIETRQWDIVLEGGAIDGDGTGRLITTRQCLLNCNRNNDFTVGAAEALLQSALGAETLCWLEDGLAADHTDGHVDNLARFVGNAKVAIPQASEADDPNAAVFEDAAGRAAGSGLTVVRLPSVGRYLIDQEIAPASYMNFYVGNSVVAVPQYGMKNDQRAVEQIGALFPDRRAVGVSSEALLRGGGSFHCISQQIPA